MKKPTLTHAFLGMLALTAALAAVLTGIYVYSAYVEKSWLRYTNTPFPVGSKKYRPGDLVETKIMRCSAINQPRQYHSSHELQCDGDPVRTLPTVDFTAAPGCTPVDAQINIAPETDKPKSCYFFGTTTVKGLIADHLVEWRTQKFDVVPRPNKKEVTK